MLKGVSRERSNVGVPVEMEIAIVGVVVGQGSIVGKAKAMIS